MEVNEMKSKWIITIAFFATLATLVGLWYEETRMTQGNWREGTSFANLEVGKNLTIESVSLNYLGETQVNCDNFPPQTQSKCEESKFFAFRTKNVSVYQGHFMAWVALPGSKRYDKNDTGSSLVIVSSYGPTIVDSPMGFYELKYVKTHPTHVEWAVETIFKK